MDRRTNRFYRTSTFDDLMGHISLSHRDMQWYAVRCCCTPKKVFGFIQAEPRAIEVQVSDCHGIKHTLSIKSLSECMMAGPGGSFLNDERAIYSDDRPIDFWRTIRGFLEVKG